MVQQGVGNVKLLDPLTKRRVGGQDVVENLHLALRAYNSMGSSPNSTNIIW